MGRLIPSALYQNEIHGYDLDREKSLGSDSVETLHGDWGRIADRIREIDPDGSVTRALLRRMQLRQL